MPRRADAAEAAAGAKGATTKPWFRPATDGPTEAELAALGRAGWTYAIGWDVDASGAATASDIAASLVSRADGGSIVRLDLGDTDVAAAMPDILDGLAAHGLVPVTVAALLGR